MDREKVVKGLECLITDNVPCDGCSYNWSDYCIKNVASDALDLLKEQERIIKQYQKADGFLFAHGWKWEGQ